jgi:uncharacterized protein (TIGR02301 family)
LKTKDNMKIWARSLLGAALIAVAPIDLALAASAPAKAPATPAAPAPQPEVGTQGLSSGPPPYDEELLRLSEILGSMHYLRTLCGGNEGSLWRDQMQGLLDAEQPDGDRRARFVDRFNRGYEGFRAVYRSCTTAATEVMDRYMAEGARIARDIVARYGKEK